MARQGEHGRGSPEIKNVLEQQEASLQRIAMWIVGLPRENRVAAINLARKVFEETFQEASLNPELGRKWVDLNTERFTRFCSAWKPAAGVDTLDAMTERAR
jgi:hypothetical protein